MSEAYKKSVPFYIQKKGKKGKYTAVTNKMSYTSKKINKHFALSPGTYRLKTKIPKGYVSQFMYVDTVYKNSYAVTKAICLPMRIKRKKLIIISLRFQKTERSP